MLQLVKKHICFLLTLLVYQVLVHTQHVSFLDTLVDAYSTKNVNIPHVNAGE